MSLYYLRIEQIIDERCPHESENWEPNGRDEDVSFIDRFNQKLQID